MIVYPSYYKEFSCVASRCRHNCCIGWEIDIDRETFGKYASVPGELGEKLRRSVSGGDAPHFLLGEGGRCPFLNGDNLCDLILALGEDSLCQICRDHPRFRNEFSGRTEMGVGLACEEAGRIILSRREPMELISEGEPAAPDPDGEEILEFREGLLEILWDTARPMAERMEELLLESDAGRISLPEGVAALRQLEVLDPRWSELLAGLPCDEPTVPTGLEPLYEYLLYRHLPAAYDDGDPAGKVCFADFAVRLIAALCAAHGDTLENRIEFARLFSGEIEYSAENTDALYALAAEETEAIS